MKSSVCHSCGARNPSGSTECAKCFAPLGRMDLDAPPEAHLGGSAPGDEVAPASEPLEQTRRILPSYGFLSATAVFMVLMGAFGVVLAIRPELMTICFLWLPMLVVITYLMYLMSAQQFSRLAPDITFVDSNVEEVIAELVPLSAEAVIDKLADLQAGFERLGFVVISDFEIPELPYPNVTRAFVSTKWQAYANISIVFAGTKVMTYPEMVSTFTDGSTFTSVGMSGMGLTARPAGQPAKFLKDASIDELWDVHQKEVKDLQIEGKYLLAADSREYFRGFRKSFREYVAFRRKRGLGVFEFMKVLKSSVKIETISKETRKNPSNEA